MPDQAQEWWIGDGGRYTPPKPPKGMRWVRHPFNRRKFVLDAELPTTPVARVAGWNGWPWVGGIAAIVTGPVMMFAALAVLLVVGGGIVVALGWVGIA